MDTIIFSGIGSLIAMRYVIVFLLSGLCLTTFCVCQSSTASTVPPPGLPASNVGPNVLRLPAVLNELDVGHHWLAGKHVDWLTGKPDGLPVGPLGHHTHCSAFVAAVCRHLEVPMLEPPQHSQELLATAQYDWLVSSAGKEAGWFMVADPVEANRLACDRKLIIAVYPSPDPKMPGHIAIVLPSQRDEKSIRADGPKITQAGLNNYARTNLRTGFKNHPLAWETARDIKFFAYDSLRSQ